MGSQAAPRFGLFHISASEQLNYSQRNKIRFTIKSADLSHLAQPLIRLGHCKQATRPIICSDLFSCS